jgi:uncharacterized membrane protein YgcG
MDDRIPLHAHHRYGVLRVPGLSVFVLIVLAFALGYPLHAEAQFARSVVWDRYDVTLDLNPDGSYHVVERQVVDFEGGPFSSGFADIPMGRIDAIENVVVREVTPQGTVTYQASTCCDNWLSPGQYTWSRRGGFMSVRWGFRSTSDQTRTFLLEYDVIGALRVYRENVPPVQQIWWTAIGKEATEVAPVRAASVTINLPEAVDSVDVVMSVDDVKVDPTQLSQYTRDGRTWTWSKQDLTKGDEFIVRLEFPPIVQAAPPRWQQADDERRRKAEQAEERRAVLNSMFLGAGLLGLVGGGLAVYGLWYLRGRDPHVGIMADFLPQPPDDLPPGAAGALIDEVVHERDIVATLVDLSRRGVIEMSAKEAAGLGTDVQVKLVDPTVALAPFEKEALNALFNWKLEAGTTANLWKASNAFGQSAGGVRSLLYEEVVKRGYFGSSPEETRTNWRNRALRLIVLLPIGGFLAWLIFFRGVGWFWFPLGALVVMTVVIYLISGALPRKTRAGAEAAAKWRAFRRYLEEIEKYEKVTERREIFDAYLPYAIAFGLEQSWVGAFANAGTPAPRWYAPVWRGGNLSGDEDDSKRWRRDEREWDWTSTTPRTWWDVTSGDRQSEERDGGDGGGLGLPDWQGTSDHAGRALSRVSDGMLSMFSTTGRALSAIADAAAESDWGSSSGGGGRSGGRSSFGGGGSRGGSSGGGGRGFR